MELYLFENLLSACNEAELFASVQGIAEKLGYSSFCYGLVMIDGGKPQPQYYVRETYPQGWIDRYFERNYIHRDLSAQHCLRTTAPLVWTHDYFMRDPDAAIIHHESIEFGINGGCCLPIHTPWLNGAGLLTLSTPDDADKVQSKVAETIGLGLMLASYLNEAARQYALPQTTSFRLAEELSSRELECLRWAATGLSAKRIADKMGLATSTVATHHLPAIRRKLGAATTREAVAIAIYHRLIQP